MKCFVHTSADSVGTCKHCSKGVCASCAIDTGDGIACSELCESHVKTMTTLMSSAVAARKINRRGAAYIMPAFLGFMGVVFGVEPLLTGRTGAALKFGLVMGGGFLACGLALAAVQHTWQKRSRREGSI